MDIHQKFATDEALENQGAWFDIGQGARLLIARAGNRIYAKTLTKMVEKHREILDLEDDSADKVSDTIMIEAMAAGILLGWENLSYKGKPIDYNVTNAKLLLSVKDFRKLVANKADSMDAFRIKEERAQGEA